MSVVQTLYPNFHAEFVDGQIANTQTCDIDSATLISAAPLPFGRAVQPGAGDREVIPGVGRVQVAQATANITNSATSLTVDMIRDTELRAGEHILIDNEVIYVTAVAAGALTLVRGALGSSPAAHQNNDAVYAFDEPVFSGIAIQDERLPGTSDAAYVNGDPVSVLWRGDVAVRVSAAVAAGDSVVIASAGSGSDATLEVVGQASSKAPSATHVQIAGARFMSAAAAQGIAVVRLAGSVPAS